MERYLILILTTILIIALAIRRFKRLGPEDKDKVKEELGNPVSLLLESLPFIGVLMIFIGLFIEQSVIVAIGIVFVFLGLNYQSYKMWKYSKKVKSFTILVSNVILVLYFYFFMYGRF
ncbi:hypothetical protein ACFFHM_15170 [Halalkalibacter kiskunsagensis]|uniref:Uncharacterized protein n=1 Tax=Halalkalibacter kiskunsagensis TaxID=1548599 RepID=A0ABV6KFH2_9BACI